MRDYVKYAGVLFTITLVVAVLLGVVNMLTAPVIEKNTADKLKLATEAVLDGKIDYTTESDHPIEGESTVQKITSYITLEGKVVYVVNVVTTGYGGEIEMVVGFNNRGLVSGIEIVNMNETPGLGANAKGNTEWLSQFMGKGQDELDAITGATVTSEAIQQGVNDARAQVMRIAGGAEFE
ncbi:MAG: FMN-binding protein [Clostridia bacterium]|nr:FMN-binding protein [Clostridia bacterium]